MKKSLLLSLVISFVFILFGFSKTTLETPASVKNDFKSEISSIIQNNTGRICGRITDESGTPIPGVSLTLTGPGFPPRTVVSDADGRYCFTGLPAGSYSLTAELEGFRSVKSGDIQVSIDRTVTYNLTMGIA